jgi:isoquinoline 1-oxidoreductase subunit beta
LLRRVGCCVARVRVDNRSSAVAVERLTIVVDAGTLVHPDGALAQVEGSALWGLSLALHEGSEFAKGQVKETNLDSYTPLRIGDVPELDIEFIESTAEPVVAPAIGNAVFAATGVRLRHLPIRPIAITGPLACGQRVGWLSRSTIWSAWHGLCRAGPDGVTVCENRGRQ